MVNRIPLRTIIELARPSKRIDQSSRPRQLDSGFRRVQGRFAGHAQCVGRLAKETKRMTRPTGLWRQTSILAVAGGLGFWVANFAISLTPIAAEYRAALLSFIALIIVTVLIELPAKALTTTSEPVRYFLIGVVFNVLRILALGLAIGYLYERLEGRGISIEMLREKHNLKSQAARAEE
jgi:hypothetical protein